MQLDTQDISKSDSDVDFKISADAKDVADRFGLKAEARKIKVISIAKGKFELLIEGAEAKVPMKALPQEIYNLIVHLDDEAHRFALTYHKKLRKKHLLQ